MKTDNYIQVEVTSSEDIEKIMVLLEGYDGTNGKVSLAYGMAKYHFERGIRYINVYDSKSIKYTTTRNKQVKLFNLNMFKKICG